MERTNTTVAGLAHAGRFHRSVAGEGLTSANRPRPATLGPPPLGGTHQGKVRGTQCGSKAQYRLAATTKHSR
jgi:hypothetical protein